MGEVLRRLGVALAVREEVRAVSDRLTALRTCEAGGRTYSTGLVGNTQVVLARSGMGPERAAASVEHLLQDWRPAELIVAGFAAALQPDVAPGDLVIASSVTWSDAAAGRPLIPSPRRLELARRITIAGCRTHLGGIATSHRIARSADEKRAIANLLGGEPVAIDMETAAAVGAAEVAGLPWLAVRAITDGVDDDFPLDFAALTNSRTGDVSTIRVMLQLVMQPTRLPGLVRLGIRSARAARNLGRFVEEYVWASTEGGRLKTGGVGR